MNLSMSVSGNTMSAEMSDTLSEELRDYRARIDAIDHQILALLAKRMGVVSEVGALKEARGIRGSFIRPGREATMMRSLIAEADALGMPLPVMSLTAIWRILIGSATGLESPLTTLCIEGDHLGMDVAERYFGPDVPGRFAPEETFFAELYRSPHAIAVLPYEVHAPWWEAVQRPLHIFACLPFVGGGPTHLAVGHVQPEETGEDISLFYHRDRQWLEAITGFCADGQHPLLEEGQARYLGSYAAPIMLTGHPRF